MEVNKLRLFINEGICKRKWNNNVIIHKKNGVVTLKIPNYNEATYKQTYMEFIIPHIEESMLKTDVWMYNLVLEECTENRIVFSEKYDSCTGEIYALIRSTEVVPDDVYIPKEKSKNVKVIRRIRFVDDECDLGDFLSNVYFIKIKLDRKEKLPLYLTYEDSKNLWKAIVFSRNVEGTWVANTEIKPAKNDEGEYISLSELT